MRIPKEYELLDMEVIAFDSEDAIVASGETDTGWSDEDEGSGGSSSGGTSGLEPMP